MIEMEIKATTVAAIAAAAAVTVVAIARIIRPHHLLLRLSHSTVLLLEQPLIELQAKVLKAILTILQPPPRTAVYTPVAPLAAATIATIAAAVRNHPR
jgi:hypothetical protein